MNYPIKLLCNNNDFVTFFTPEKFNALSSVMKVIQQVDNGIRQSDRKTNTGICKKILTKHYDISPCKFHHIFWFTQYVLQDFLCSIFF